ncbi:hypothetical protein H5410_062149 [Solanum commersonii]|uniref:Uncharacterized protein n=1 Tax=Solanum commersonii TaxID=4109 RepID=A0A9J5WAP0_SOLCO|nr:hypothetical protein H5410_062149 [Solanum commersonii]
MHCLVVVRSMSLYRWHACLEIVEVHTPDRVMRQFGHPQYVPVILSWGAKHHVHDQRRRLGSEVLEMLDKYFRDWGRGAGGIPIPQDIEAKAGVEADDLHIHQFGTSDIMNSRPTTIIEDIVPTVNEDPDVTQIHTTGPSSIVDSSPTTIIEDIVSTVNEDLDVTQTILSPLSSPNITFIIPVDDMPQTPGRKKVVKRIVKNVNIKDLPAKKRKKDNEDEDGYTGLRPRDVLRISRKGCGT